MDVNEIEKRVDLAIAAPIPLDMPDGPGLVARTWGEAMEAAKLMAIAGPAVPRWLRGNRGSCFAVCMRAYRWGMDPFGVAEKTYVVINRGEERIAYEAQLVHAVVTTRANLKNRLRYEIIGEGDERRCKVSATFKGEDKPHEYTSETLGKKREAIGRNEQGKLKGSPLWDTDPEVQLCYSAVRQWARLHASDVLLGVYTPDEIQDEPRDVTPQVSGLAQRLKDAKKSQTGFDAGHVASTAGSIIEGDKEADNEVPEGSQRELGDEGRRDQDADRTDSDRDETARAGVRGTGEAVGGEPAADSAASAQAEIFPPDSKSKAKGGKRR